MSAVVSALIIIGIPALVGATLPRLMRWVGASLAMALALYLFAVGLNVHTGSMLVFMICSAFVAGALARDLGTGLVKVFRTMSRERTVNHG